jgi:chromosome segregation ATPase
MASEEGGASSVSDAQQQLAEFSQTVFTDLQHDFHELNHEIQKDSPLEPFRHEYAKLFGILQKSMTNQARYIDKCRVLESEIVGNKAKVRTVSKLSEEDARSISNLNDEREKKQAVLSDNQALLHEVMEQNIEVSNRIKGLESDLEALISSEKSDKDKLRQLKTRKLELTREYEDLATQIPQLQESNRVAGEKMQQKEKEIEESRAELRRIEDMVDSKHREGQAEQQRLFDLERDREATRIRLRDAQQYLKDRLAEVSQHQDSVRQLEKRVREQKRRFDGVKQDKQEATERNLKFQKDLDNLNQAIVAVEKEIKANNQKLTDKQSEVKLLQQQVQQSEAERERHRLRQQELQDSYEQLKKEGDAVKNQVHGRTEEIERMRREGESIRKQCDAITREENAKLKKKEGELQKQHTIQVLLSLYKNQAHNIECEISIIKTHLQDTQKKIFTIENDRERYSEELSAATSQFLHAQDVLREVEGKVAQKNKEMIDDDKKVHQQQALYEKTRSERENAAKKVKEVEAEIKQLEGMFARMKFAIEQHKEDIKRKDRERMTDKRALEDVNREDGRLSERLSEVLIDSKTAATAITAHEGELAKAAMTVSNAETRLHSDEQKLAAVKKRRDQMSNLNVEREMELKGMHEKLEVIRNQCRRGEVDYDHTEAEISRIRTQLQQDQKRLAKLSEVDAHLRRRREHIHNKQKELYRLQAERTAMEEELAIPINIHNWNLLESSDPARFDSLKRYQELQADLVAKTREVSHLQELVKQKEVRYMELCAQLRRKPGLEVDQRVTELTATCKTERLNLEQITSNLEMYRDMVKEYQKELADVQSELINKRDRWIRQKKRDLKHRQTLAEQQQTLDELGLDIVI